jgi:hypothetical protein
MIPKMKYKIYSFLFLVLYKIIENAINKINQIPYHNIKWLKIFYHLVGNEITEAYVRNVK